jgi:uncharacterized integral membrane protein
MKKMDVLLSTPLVLLASQTQAAVDVTGFTIQEASRPYGLILMVVLLVGIGLARLRTSS